MVCQSQKLNMKKAINHYKAQGIDLSKVLYKPDNSCQVDNHNTEKQNHNLDIFYPGHRHKILAPNPRIDEILQHHRNRLDQIVSLLTNPTDIWNLSTRIFGQLDGIHALYGSGEIFAHLEYLESMDLVTSSDGLYSLTAPSVDISTIF